MYYQAPRVEDGLWSVPYFACDGDVDEWVVTYSTPFFGLNSVASDIEFKCVLAVFPFIIYLFIYFYFYFFIIIIIIRRFEWPRNSRGLMPLH